MACSVSNLTQLFAINGITARWKDGCTATNINDVTFFPVGKRLQPMVGLMSSPYQRRRNGLVVKAQEESTKTLNAGEESTKTLKAGEESTKTQTEIPKSMSHLMDAFWPKGKMLQIVDMTERQGLPVRPPWEATEKENEIVTRLDMPGLSKKDVEVSLVGERFLEIKEKPSGQSDLTGSSTSYRSYYTRLTLPENSAKNQIKATFENGVLNITVPKTKVQPESPNLPDKIVAEFKNGMLSIAIPASKMEETVSKIIVE